MRLRAYTPPEPLDAAWLAEHSEHVYNSFPETFTHLNNIDWAVIRRLCQYWSLCFTTDDEFWHWVLEFNRCGLIIAENGNTVKRSNRKVKVTP